MKCNHRSLASKPRPQYGFWWPQWNYLGTRSIPLHRPKWHRSYIWRWSWNRNHKVISIAYLIGEYLFNLKSKSWDDYHDSRSDSSSEKCSNSRPRRIRTSFVSVRALHPSWLGSNESSRDVLPRVRGGISRQTNHDEMSESGQYPFMFVIHVNLSWSCNQWVDPGQIENIPGI